jgi:hypothetical protein
MNRFPAFFAFAAIIFALPSAAQFQPTVYYRLGPRNGEPIAIATADFNNDGYLDLVAGDTFLDHTVILLNQGDGSFVRSENLLFQPISIATGDLNGDGNQDFIAIATGEIYLRTFLGNGDGTFRSGTQISLQQKPVAVVIADFDGDGNLDCATANYGNPHNGGSVTIVFGNGQGGFAGKTSYSLLGHPSSLVVGDFNRDGHPDLAVTKQTDYRPQPSLSIVLNNGDGTFAPEVLYDVGNPGEALGLIATDLNHDGLIDLAVGNDGVGIDVLLGNGDGTFGLPALSPTLPPFNATQGEAVADFNLDGNADIAIAGCACLLYGNGDGTFQAAAALNEFGGYSLVAGDFDNNNAADVAFADFSLNSVAVLLNSSGNVIARPKAEPRP